MPFDLPGYGSFERVLVVGAARSGLAAARLLAARGAHVVLADRRPANELADAVALAEAEPQIQLHTGSHPSELAQRADLVVVSPGVPLDLPVLEAARARGLPVVAEVELAAKLVRARLVGITGANGKSTTTALVAEIARAAGLRAEPVGNFGRPLSELVGGENDLLAVELSSFQLEGIRDFRPDVALYLNLSPDHLDRYRSLDAYHAAKARIFRAQRPDDYAVLNADDARVRATPVGARKLHFSRHEPVPAGAFVRDDRIVFRPREGGEETIAPITDVRIPGPHNLENALAATAAARALGLPAEAIRRALASFPGLPHRSEPVGEIGGVLFVNDSKGTNVDATLKSLAAWSGRPLWIILGGRDKGGDFAPLAAALARHEPRAVALTIGEAASKIETALAGRAEAVHCETLARAVERAIEVASSGDVVLLSPACASFDQFRNFEHRGDELRRLVRERAAPREA